MAGKTLNLSVFYEQHILSVKYNEAYPSGVGCCKLLGGDSGVVVSLFGIQCFCVWSLFCNAVPGVLSSFVGSAMGPISFER